jgi:hypothetical protein
LGAGYFYVKPQAVTNQARLVLDDARAALRAHSNELQGPAFRASWFSVVGLLRAVGHVLSKVDAPSDLRLAQIVSDAWSGLVASRPQPAIFWGFIEAERNRILKNYEHGITRVRVFRAPDTQRVLLALDMANASSKAVQVVNAFDVPADVPDRGVFSALSDGPFAGRSERSVAEEAIQWWDCCLSAIEQEWRAGSAV